MNRPLECGDRCVRQARSASECGVRADLTCQFVFGYLPGKLLTQTGFFSPLQRHTGGNRILNGHTDGFE